MVKPWDLFKPNQPRTTDYIYNHRLDICDACPELIQLTKQCKKCGCFMPGKAKLENAKCPLEKW